jgi:glycerol-1-phosphate dehydrogenase [NAD(P)+]
MGIHGLPRTPADLGLGRDDFVAAVGEAPRTRPDRFTILEHLDPTLRETEELVDAYVATVAG